MSTESDRDDLQNKLRGWVLLTTRFSVEYVLPLVITFPLALTMLSLPAGARHFLMFKDRSEKTLASARAMKDLGSLVVPPVGETT